jgi:hypothetical protein
MLKRALISLKYFRPLWVKFLKVPFSEVAPCPFEILARTLLPLEGLRPLLIVFKKMSVSQQKLCHYEYKIAIK